MDYNQEANVSSFLSNPIVKYVIIFIVLNAILWGGQELYYYKDTKKINEIDSFLTSEKTSITALEDKISLEEDNIKSLDSRLESYQSLGYIDDYNNGVGSFNNLLETYKSDLDNYNLKLTNYNTKVDEMNVLIKKSGTRWYLIPIPLPGKSVKSKL